MQARFILQALLLAVRDQRVLLEIPSSHPNRSRLWCDRPPYTFLTLALTLTRTRTLTLTRCDRPPYTFGCVFEPWSYCAAPDLERAKAAGQI